MSQGARTGLSVSINICFLGLEDMGFCFFGVFFLFFPSSSSVLHSLFIFAGLLNKILFAASTS